MLEPKSLEQGFSPLDQINQALRYWWFLFALVLLGGIIGLAAQQLRSPVYEAVGHFTASIDYVATGPLTQYDEDVTLNAVGNVILSSTVLDRVTRRAKSDGIILNRTTLKQMATLERRFTTWDLRVRSTNAQTADTIASLWVEEGQAQLLESYQHALKAQQLDRYLRSLENCLEKSVAGEPSPALCTHDRFAEIQADMAQAGEVLVKERRGSLGLFSGVTIGPAGPVSTSSGPVLYGRGQFALSGGIIGLLAGLWLLFLGIPVRWLKRS
jgi:hypothetical protein